MDGLFSVKDKVVVITGALGSIGRAYAIGFAGRGAHVVLLDREETGNKELLQELTHYGTGHCYYKVDLLNVKEIEMVVDAIYEMYGRIDVLVNHAGMNIRKPALDFAEEEWDTVVDVNAKGMFFMAKEVGRVMLKQGYGKIINTASVSSARGHKGLVAYAASKGAVVQMTKVLAHEWADKNIQVNAIGPGYIRTNQTESYLANKENYEAITRHIPMKRVGTPEDLVGGCIFLASNASNYVTGHTLYIEGGRLID